ncbi:hypothetical protein [Protaetiibacter mangrovi]|uniref:LPXTG cell wall anchor domain-containing protein n=1 Tax=Protaetiibacter mangrovi TaxID=2970926 RepID=A0ABT1ZFX0_9MICO|nr:hypothetical protein [Protaetiibacter mangrovi]MCS0499597.1 hypothetical protein [Protaetiibacter mangrovi]
MSIAQLAATGVEGWQIALLVGGIALMVLGAVGVVLGGRIRRRGR